jgi:excisionase family DNA binding protein
MHEYAAMTLMTTQEVASYLRLKERKVYELVRQKQIPCTRVTGKLLFPRDAIEFWVMSHLEGDQALSRPAPPVYAGSQDPLLEWALREADTDLATLCNGSGDGVRRLLDGRAQLVGLHLVDPATGEYNRPAHCGLGGLRDLVMITWATRRQGLVVAAGNPLGIRGVSDLAQGRLRVAFRQPEAGADALFRMLLARHRLHPGDLTAADRAAHTEDDLAAAVQSGRADCGLAVEAAAHRHGLDFVPLVSERFDLAMRRRSYFEPPVQRLVAFTRSEAFRRQAAAFGGYDIGRCGEVAWNA